jgi:Na+-transporting methylmalonyl-CoA/oxaloacetate decarboxylase gamma subunit
MSSDSSMNMGIVLLLLVLLIANLGVSTYVAQQVSNIGKDENYTAKSDKIAADRQAALDRQAADQAAAARSAAAARIPRRR